MNLGYAYPLFPSGKEYDDVWTLRKKGLGLMMGIKGEKKALSFIEDSAIPTEVLPEYIDQVLKICAKHNTEVSMYAHASVGVIHVQPLLDLRQQEDIENLKNITDETFELVVKYGGSWSGEHGDGLVRSAYNERFFGPQVYQAFRRRKEIIRSGKHYESGKDRGCSNDRTQPSLWYKVSGSRSKGALFIIERKIVSANLSICVPAWENAERCLEEQCAPVSKQPAMKNILHAAGQMRYAWRCLAS